MLNRYKVRSTSWPLTLPPLQPYLVWSHKQRLKVSALITRDWARLSSYRQRERALFSRAGIISLKPLNEPKHEQRACFFASHASTRSNVESTPNRNHVQKRRRSRPSPTRPLPLPTRRQSRRNCAKSRLYGRVRIQLANQEPRWRLHRRGSRRRGGGGWHRRLYLIRKPLRWPGPYNEIRRSLWVSLGGWPKESKWTGRESKTHALEEIEWKLDWDWVLNFPTLKTQEGMQDWTRLDTDQIVRYYAGACSSRDHVDEKWMALRDSEPDRLWRNVMLWCLRYQKKQALMLLLATFKGRRYIPPRIAVSDSLEFLARHFLFQVSTPSPMIVDAIWLLTCKFIDGASGDDRNFTVPQHLVFLVLQHVEDLRVLSFYWLLGLNKYSLHVNTMLHLLERFLDMGRVNLSMKLLSTIVNTGYDLSKDQVQWACVKLLRARFDTETEYAVRSNILTQILEMGIRPKLPMFNAILHNAAEGKDFANAWQMYCLAKENSVIPDSATYGILLKGAVISGESSNLELVIREVQANSEVLQDLRLVSDMLNAVSLLSPGDQFGAMLDFYKQHCDLRPLQELALCGDEIKAPPGANCSGVLPTSHILTRMILCYVKLHQGSVGLIHNYNLYYQLVKGNHPLVAPLAREDFVANAFLLAFGMNPATLRHCTTVVKHMLEFSSPKFVSFENIPYAAPTVQTWSILVGAYFRHRQRRAAEKVLDMMHERGIQGDRVTWNNIIHGYAFMQDAESAADTVKRMEAAGFEADSYTSRALGKLWVRDRLTKALETSIPEKSVKERIHIPLLQLPPLDAAEQHEAKVAMEWEPKNLNRGKEVKEYLKAKDQNWLDTDVVNTSDNVSAFA